MVGFPSHGVDAWQALIPPHRCENTALSMFIWGGETCGRGRGLRGFCRKALAEGACKENIVDDEVCTTHTHVARLRVMKTLSERYRGIVYLHRIGEDPGSSEQHHIETEFSSDVEARDAARALARILLEKHKS